MKTVMKKFSMLSVLAASLFAAGCDALQEPVEPRLNPGGMVVMSTGGEKYTVAVEKDADAGSVSAEIGSAGGRLVLGKHELLVSQGAVSEAATFTMARNAEEPLRVKVTATRVTENDVGAAGFAAPVTLKISYENAAALPADASSIAMLYFRPDGLVETLSASVETHGHRVSSDLPHFSLFGLGWP